MKTFGFIVGIDKYDQSGWSLSGPCRNALAVANWMITIADPKDIWVFVDPVDDLQTEIAGLVAKGVNVKQSACSNEIDVHCFETLPASPTAGAKLLAFWSGHGYVNNNGDRIFICRDYTNQAFNNRVLNVTRFLRHLGSPRFKAFTEKLLLADVCGIQSSDANVRIDDPREGPEKSSDKGQLALFATPEGEYARDENGQGVFTKVTLEVLRRVGSFPDLENFGPLLTEALKKAGQKPFRLDAFGHDGHTVNQLLGSVTGNTFFEEVFAILNVPSVMPDKYRFHYRRTVAVLGNPALHSAQGLAGMLRELFSLRDSQGGGLPYGLLNFLVRLTKSPELPELEQPLNEWLTKNCATQANDLAGMRKQLDVENQSRILIIETENDPNDEITTFEPFLRTPNLAPVPHEALKSTAVAGWSEFQTKLIKLINELDPDSISQIQFLVNPPLFDRPFHEIPSPLKNGLTLGEDFVVLLRHRDRLFSRRPQVRNAWTDYADSLRTTSPKSVKAIPLASPNIAAAERGICYFTQLVPFTNGAGCNPAEKAVLLRLLTLGVPYLCWLHKPDAVDWSLVGKFLTDCAADQCKTLDEYPTTFTSKRLAQDPFANGATLLWDDPRQNPFE